MLHHRCFVAGPRRAGWYTEGVDDGRSAREASVDTGALYERVRRDFVAVVEALPDEQLDRRVLATPAWAGRDGLAHVVGLAADLNAQRFPEPDDVGGVAWADHQVELRRTWTVVELTAEWEREAATFEDGLRAFGYEFGSHFVADVHAHQQDVRNTVGLPPDNDELTVAVALDHYLGFIDELLADAKWGALEVVAGTEVRQLGASEGHCARVRAAPFELLRAFSARRSVRQVLALDWDGDVHGLLALLQAGFGGGYSFPMADLDE